MFLSRKYLSLSIGFRVTSIVENQMQTSDQILNTDLIYRGVHPELIKGDGSISYWAFGPDPGIVFDGQPAFCANLMPQKIMRSPASSNGNREASLASILVSIPRELDLGVERNTDLGDNAFVYGNFSRKKQRRLADEARLITR